MAQIIRMQCPSCQASWDLDASASSNGSLAATCPRCGNQVGEDVADAPPRPPAPDLMRSEEPTPVVATRPKAVPKRIGRFELRRIIGDGGYGRVYLAYDPKLDREVALKVLKSRKIQSKALKRFFRESQAAARLNHASIVTLYDAGYDQERCWIAYQPIDGEPLSRQIGTRELTVPRAVDILISVAWALDHAHSRGVYHRDLKPANILIDRQGHARLTDFGLARQVHVNSDLTREGMVLGTPAYMSPEQAAGQAHLADGRTDIYSLGVIMREMVAGPPSSPASRPRWQLDGAKPSRAGRALPAELERICRRATRVRREERYASARAMAEALEAYRDRSNPWAWITPGVMVGVLTGVLLVGLVAGLVPTLGRLSVGGFTWNPPGAAESAGAQPRQVIVGNHSSKIYHRPDCKNSQQISTRNRVEFPTEEAALGLGFSACQLCRP